MRKRIGLITICPEDDYQQRIMEGVFSQCRKYDYDVLVFSPLVKVATEYKDYLQGELNIYELINYDMLDGVIVTPIPMTEDRIEAVEDMILKALKEKCKAPVVSLGLEFGDYPAIFTDDTYSFEQITDHILDVHACKRIAVLTGMKDYSISQARITGVRNSLAKHGMELSEDDIYYGDFWYTSGEKTAAQMLASGKPLPEAMICGSDSMAIGFTNYMIKAGVRVPEDLIVTGFDARAEAVVNNPNMTTYVPNDALTGALCVNYLHSQLEPDAPEEKPDNYAGDSLKIGATCGCPEDIDYARSKLADSIYLLHNDFSNLNVRQGANIGRLMESYTSEILTGTTTPLSCLEKIYESIYLIKPYGWFYLCMSEDWLNLDKDRTYGYTDHMHLVIASDMAKIEHGYDSHVFFGPDRTIVFDTTNMLPALFKEFDTPQVFYFAPIHFNNVTLGYAVLQNDLTLDSKPGIMYRNYLRYINNSLEMSRTKNKITNISEHDMMTGLLNRRGMERAVNQLTQQAGEDASYLCIVIDMDGLKLINDNYGHREGDRGITAVADVCREITRGQNEICVRGGGDEFYVIGIGNYSEAEAKKKLSEFRKKLAANNAAHPELIPVNASIGYALRSMKTTTFNETMDDADVQMYIDKRKRKR